MSTPHSHQLGYKLKLVQHKLRLKMDQDLAPLSLTTPQYAVLAQLQSQPGISNAALARASFITPQTMHGILSNLSKAGLIRRAQDPHHGRVLNTELTAQGCKVVKKAHALVKKAEQAMTKGMKEVQIKSLASLLEQCLDNLDT